MIIFAYLFVDDTPSIRSKRAITSTLRASLHLVEQCLYSIVCYCYSIVFFCFTYLSTASLHLVEQCLLYCFTYLLTESLESRGAVHG